MAGRERNIDPEALGRFLLSTRKMFPDKPLSEIYDIYKDSIETLPRYAKHDSIGLRTAQVYKTELEGRKDKYAKSTLERIYGEQKI